MQLNEKINLAMDDETLNNYGLLVSHSFLDDDIKKINVKEDILNKNLKFEKDYYYDKQIVKIYNKETGDEIKQIPAKEVLEFAKKSEEIIGLLFDEII